jgi:hypothetical protein
MEDESARLVWHSTPPEALYAESQSLLTRRRIMVAALVFLALTTVAFAIATAVLAIERLDSDDNSDPALPCPPVPLTPIGFVDLLIHLYLFDFYVFKFNAGAACGRWERERLPAVPRQAVGHHGQPLPHRQLHHDARYMPARELPPASVNRRPHP